MTRDVSEHTNSDVVVTGLGCVCAAGGDVPLAMDALYAGRRSPGPVTSFETEYRDRYPVFEFKSDLNVDCPEGELTRTARLGIVAANEAIAQSGIETGGLRTGVCMGTTVGCALNAEEFYEAFRSGRNPGIAPVRRYLRSNPAESLAHHLGAKGPSQAINNACSSGTDAIGLGASWIRAGLADVAIAGGADELSRISFLGFISLMIFSESPCRPFDVNRSGLNLGEGAGVVVMESAAHAQQRGATPLAIIRGYGLAADAHHLTAPKPGGPGLRAATDRALGEAGISASDIDFINAHGTGTKDNDLVESGVIGDIYGEGIPFLSTKGYTGHTLGAAGGLEAVFTIACLRDGRLPPSVGFADQDPDLGVTPVTSTREIDAQYAISQSLAFGGNNSVLVLERN